MLRELRRLFLTASAVGRFFFAARIMGISFYSYQLDGRSNQVLDFPEAIIQAGYEVQQSIRAPTDLAPLLSAGWLFRPAWFSLAFCPTLFTCETF
jgi:hypothetical protein